MKRALIVLFFSFLVQLNAFADDATVAFMQKPSGTNLLLLIDDSKTQGSATQTQSFYYLMGYILGIDHSIQHLTNSVNKLIDEANKSIKKTRPGVKLTQEENERVIRAEAAMSVSPTGPMYIPNEVTYGQKVSILEKFLHDHPEKLHESAYTLFVQALSDAFKGSR